ncbi:leucine-rich repeat receptor-like protein kinase TDR [Punica granatum]|uniref:non-specific serine/threonine protein kinase n=2 Tax=Punica granatum TaxID=22663 RepID=A0A218X510_PUNGR|nr:leucine-rich repeat receptor-like protein kinase TDR [Punica granatum]OWM79442.1 hypothetical protein CDL15_Pgr022854 [Punica granatum]PKI39244.1 hypothetical protein CRG98_040373 [Punica granatum]
MKASSSPFFFFFFFFLLIILLLALHCSSPVLSASLPLQLISLLSIKSALTDPHSTFRDWEPLPAFSKPSLENPEWCSWSGVKCDPATALITSLNLSHRNLSGSIPPEIRFLTGLQHLNLSNNSFSGPLQGAMFELTNLRTIDMNHNSFISTFPPGVSKLKLLRVFNAYSNNFTGSLPKEFSELQHLQYLNLGGSFFGGEIPAEYGNFLRLKSLYLNGNNLTGPIPPQLGQLTQLQHLEIGYNRYSGGIPSELGALENLRYLDIVMGNLSGPIPPEFGNLTKLETLLVYQNSISGPIPSSFGSLVALQTADLSMNQISGPLPEELGSLNELTLLNLMFNNLTGEIPESISEMKSLAILQLWENSLTGNLPARLGSNGKLSKLDVSSNLLTGSVPPNLCVGNKLEKLILFSNKFTGELPRSLTGCTSLYRLRAQNNMLSGSIPRRLASLPSLTYMDLSQNNLTGPIPDDLGTAPALQYLNISHNSFQCKLPGNLWSAPSLQIFSAASSNIIGQIPDFAACRSIYVMELGGNSFNGTVPSSISRCQRLVCMNISGNLLTGNIPAEISELPEIADIDLSYNSLSGTIPPSFDNCDTLRGFNVSFNLLTGPIPSASEVFRHFQPSSFLGNEGLCGAPLGKLCEAADSARDQRPRRTTGAIVWIVAAAFAVGLFVLIAGSRYLHVNYRNRFNMNEAQGPGPWKLIAFQRLNFTVDELLECLSISEKVIGMGSSGTVYRAEIPGGDAIAVKKLGGKQKDHIRRRRGVLAEVDVLGNVKHRNIVRLLGCCSNRECTMLLYEYMPNGNLDDLLHGKNKAENLMADWLTRYKIALGVAQGICYLHHDCNPAIVHRDVKPSNILLDAEMEARVADFGVAKLIQGNESMSVIAGSYGYIAPEYAYTLRVDEKSDIYSYGVVLMEMLSGRRSVDAEFGEGNSIVEWIRSKIKLKNGVDDILDKNAGSSCLSVKEEMIQMLKIALLCTSANPADRPSMRDVVLMLQEVRPDRKLAGILPGEGGHAQKPGMGY